MDEKKEKDNREIRIPPSKIAETIPLQGKGEIKADTEGSYTGISIDGEKPVQDADDL